jgi:hypothetical protein
MGIRYRGSSALFLIVVLAVLSIRSWQPEPVAAQAGKAEFKLKLMGINRTLDP